MPQPILSLLSLALATALIPQNTHGFSTKPFSRPKDTKVTAAGKSTATVIPPSTALSDHSVTLTNYMRLPVEQYVLIPMPLGSSLTRIKNKNNMDDDDGGGGGGTRITRRRRTTTITENSYTDNDDNDGDNANEEDGAGEEFELVVPTITFFNLSLQPVVYASVYPQQNKVIISSDKCLLRGSPFIEKVKLNDRFDFNVCCTLTWEDTLVASQSSLDNADGKDGHEGGTTTQFNDMTLEMQQTHDANNLSEFMKNKDNNNDVHGETTQQQQQQRQCSITAETTIRVDVNVPRPFNSLPKIVLEKTGSTAMQLSMKYIQGNFVANLANDYEKWATDLEYRLFRASLSSEERAKEEEGKGRIENDDHSVLMELEETF